MYKTDKYLSYIQLIYLQINYVNLIIWPKQYCSRHSESHFIVRFQNEASFIEELFGSDKWW